MCGHEESYACEICEQNFVKDYALKIHKRVVHTIG